MDRQPGDIPRNQEAYVHRPDDSHEKCGDECSYTDKAKQLGQSIKEKGSELLDKTKKVFTGDSTKESDTNREGVLHKD